MRVAAGNAEDWGTEPAEAFKLLAGLGLDPWVEDNEGRTAIDVAAAYQNEDVEHL